VFYGVAARIRYRSLREVYHFYAKPLLLCGFIITGRGICKCLSDGFLEIHIPEAVQKRACDSIVSGADLTDITALRKL
jgi:hypothetical protein